MSGDFKVGWIGIGKMGAPMSRRVLDSGFRLTIHDPVAENTKGLAEAGAHIAPSVASLAAAADAIFLTLPNDQALQAVVLGKGGLETAMKTGQVLIDMSTVSPEISAKIARNLAEKGIGYLRAPVSGSTATAASGNLTVIVSGEAALCDLAEPVFASFASRITRVGGGEEARYLKLVLNALVGATSALIGEALVLGRKGGLPAETILDAICESAVASPLIAYKRDMLVKGDFTPAFSVSQMMKDFDLILDTAKAIHAPMYLTALIRQQYEAAWSEGHAEQDFFILAEHYARLGSIDKTA